MKSKPRTTIVTFHGTEKPISGLARQFKKDNMAAPKRP